MNYVRTGILLAAMTALFGGVGLMIGGQTGMIIALIIAIAMNGFSYWNSDKMVLRMYNAHPVSESEAPQLYRMVRRLAANADLPMPKVYLIDDPQPNAFATGRDPEHAAVAATTGLINMLTEDEVAGVMAHELAHIKNRDILTMTITASLAGAITMLAQFGMFFSGRRDNPLGFIGTLLVVLLAPVAAGLVQMAISRSREYQADRLGAEIAQNPLALASALRKIAGAAHQIPMDAAESNPATAHMFIINPLTGQSMDNLFSTHPNTENRIRALEALAADWGQTAAASSRHTARRNNPWSDRENRKPPRGPWG